MHTITIIADEKNYSQNWIKSHKKAFPFTITVKVADIYRKKFGEKLNLSNVHYAYQRAFVLCNQYLAAGYDVLLKPMGPANTNICRAVFNYVPKAFTYNYKCFGNSVPAAELEKIKAMEGWSSVEIIEEGATK
jgi:hypothetical protein